MNPEIHELANLFPLMTDDAINTLATNIRENGLLEKIVLYDGKILDGRNRFMACLRAGVTPEFEQYQGNDPLQYVISLNLHRRHLNESQRAVIAERLANMTVGNISGSNQHERKAAKMPDSISQAEAAKMLNVSERTVRNIKAVKESRPELIEQIVSGKLTAGKAYKETQREEKLATIKEIAEQKKVNPLETIIPELILADPPWRYDFAETANREIENQYPTATLDEIKKHKPETADNCILFLWATAPKLVEAMAVIEAWGFTYKTHAIWDKVKIGMGYWFRGRHELLLVATKGKAEPPVDEQRVSSIFTEPRQGHSQKPECVYQWIETTFPHLNKLEMYARIKREGWYARGNEL